MRVGRYRFAPPWWGIVATMIGIAVFSAAGVWQIQRGLAKDAMLTQRSIADQTPAQSLAEALDAGGSRVTSSLYGRDFVIHGHYTDGRQVLLDNQKTRGRIGYEVWTPLVMPEGHIVLVNRGWIPLGPGGRNEPPVPTIPNGQITVKGLFTNLPQAGIRLSEPTACHSGSWPRVLNYPSIETIRCLYDRQVVAGLVLLDADAPHGFIRNWHTDIGGMPPMRHYGYAFQWFALAAAVVVVFILVNRKRIR